ncbi:hypothetical protein D3C73_1100980 [compost metagenome]
MNDIIAAAKRRQNVMRKFVLCYRFCFAIILCYLSIFTTWCLQVKFADHEAETEIVNDRKNQTDNNYIPPWGASRNYPKDHVVDQTTGKCHPDFCAKNMHGHERQTCEYAVNCK